MSDIICSLYAAAPIGREPVNNTNNTVEFTDSAGFEQKMRGILDDALTTGITAPQPLDVTAYAVPDVCDRWWERGETGTTITYSPLGSEAQRILALEERMAQLEARVAQLEKPKAKTRPKRKK